MTATDATVTGLKMWDTSCAWTTHVQCYLMINVTRQWTPVGLLNKHEHMEN